MRSKAIGLAILLLTACSAQSIIGIGTSTVPTPIPTGISRTPFSIAVPAPADNPVSVPPQKVAITREQPDRYVASGLSTFRILQLTDIHFDDTVQDNLKTKQLITQMVQRFHPNLIVVTGDMAWSLFLSTKPFVEEGSKFLNDLSVANDCYWAYTIGNHDAWDAGSIVGSDNSGFKRKDLAAVVAPYALDKPNGRLLFNYSDLSASVRYALELQGTPGTPLWNLLFLDNTKAGLSRWYLDGSTSVSDRLWYAETYAQASMRSNTSNLPAFAFFHIPLTQFGVWKGNEAHGFKYGSVDGQADSVNVLETLGQNGTVACFAGHDHNNNYRAQWALANRNLYFYFGRYSGYGAPRGELNIPTVRDFGPGGLIIDMDLASRCWTCWQWDESLGDNVPRNLDAWPKVDLVRPTPLPWPH